MARMLLSFFAVLLMEAYSHPAGLECATDTSTRLRVGQTIMKATVANAPADSPIKVEVQGATVTVTSQVGTFFAARAFGAGATISPKSGDSSLSLTKDCSNQVYTVDGKSTTYTFTQSKAESIVVGYASGAGVVSLVTAKVASVAASEPGFCPSSAAPVHAWAQITSIASADCSTVRVEILARIAGQANGTWHDPHNNGTYHLEDAGSPSWRPQVIHIDRVTGNHKPGPYTDEIQVILSDISSHAHGACKIEACSVSEAFSVYDFGTNYCNIRMLYCGSADGCKPVKADFTSPDGTVKTSIGASKGISNCLKVNTLIV